MIEQPINVSDPTAITPDLPSPSRRGLWAQLIALGGTYAVIQLIVPLGVVVWMTSTRQAATVRLAIKSPTFILASLIGIAIAGAVTVFVSIKWPQIWHAVSKEIVIPVQDWVSWHQIQFLPGWSIVFLTLALFFFIELLLTGLILVKILPVEKGPNLQAQLFETPISRIVASIVVSTIVPVAEELIFRGAFFNALTSFRPGLTQWQRNALPFLVTSSIFAAIHYFTGVNTLTGMIGIVLLSFFLGGLRAVTGSIKASLIAHATWNLLGAVALIVYSIGVH